MIYHLQKTGSLVTFEKKYVTEHQNHRRNLLILDTGQEVTTPLNQYVFCKSKEKQLNDILEILPHLRQSKKILFHLHITTDTNIWYLRGTE